MRPIKDFLYLDTSLVNSIFSQYYNGVITSMSRGSLDKEGAKETLGFDLKLVKGNAGGSTASETNQSETIDLHHYAYAMLEDRLTEDGIIDGTSKDIVMLSGNLRIIDAIKTIERFDGLKTLISGFDAAMKLATKPTQNNTIPQEVKNAAQKSKDISRLLSQLSNNGIFAYMVGEKVALDRDYLVGTNSPEFMNNGKLFEGKYVVVGLNSKLSALDDNEDKGDMLLSLSKAFTGFQDIMNASTIKPIAIYRLV